MDTRGYLHNAQDQLLTAHDALPQADSMSANLETPKKKGLFGRLTEKFKSAVEDTRAKVADVLTKERYLPGQKQAEEAISTVARSGMEQLATRVEAVSSAVVEQTKQLWEASQDTVAKMNTVVKGAALAGTTLATLTACGGNIAPTASYVPLQATPAPVASASPEAKEEATSVGEMPEFSTILRSRLAAAPFSYWDEKEGELYTGEEMHGMLYVQKAGWENHRLGGNRDQVYTLSPEPIKTFDLNDLLNGKHLYHKLPMRLREMVKVGDSVVIFGTAPGGGAGGAGAIVVNTKTADMRWIDTDRTRERLEYAPVTMTANNQEHVLYVSWPNKEQEGERRPELRIFTEGEEQVRSLVLKNGVAAVNVKVGLVGDKEHVFVFGSPTDDWKPSLYVYTPEQLLTSDGTPAYSIPVDPSVSHDIAVVGSNVLLTKQRTTTELLTTLLQFNGGGTHLERDYRLVLKEGGDQFDKTNSSIHLFQSTPDTPLLLQTYANTGKQTYLVNAALPGSETIGISSVVPQALTMHRYLPLGSNVKYVPITSNAIGMYTGASNINGKGEAIIRLLNPKDKIQEEVVEKKGATVTASSTSVMNVKSVPLEYTFSSQGGPTLTE